MAQEPFASAARPIARSLSDFAHALEASGDPGERLRHALTLLHEVVPYDICALVEAAGEQCEVLAIPEPAEQDQETIRTALLSRLRELQERPDLQEARLTHGLPVPSHLAVPLVVQGKVIGLLFVGQGAPGAYGEQELSLLSIVAAQIAAHLAARSFREQEARHLQRITFQAHILNMVEQAVIATDLEGRITYWNRYAQTIFGWSADEAIGHDIQEILPLEELLDQEAQILSRVCAGETVPGETLSRSKDGRVFPIAYILSPIYTQDGTITGIVGIANDISPRKRGEEETERLRSEFLGMVTHELRTPLTAIKGAAAIGVREGSLSETETRGLFQVVGEQADRLHEMIGNLLDMSRIEAGFLTVRTESTDARDMVEEAVNIFNRSGGRTPATVRTSGKLPNVSVDRHKIIQVITNLLNNATRYSPPGEPIIVDAEQQGQQIAVHIRDRGMGIPPDKLGDVFKPFPQVHGPGTTVEVAGLGLAICKGIVEAHGGQIWAESEGTGKGSTFSFTLPAAVNVETGPPPPTPVRRQEAKRILAVDDDPQVLRYLERWFENAGYQVVTTTEASQVPTLVEMEQPDIVLLDLMLPGASGFDVFDRIREFSKAPVIFLTARSRQEDMVRALKMGADDYVTKPFAPSELQARIEVALRRHTTEQPTEQSRPFILDDLAVNFAERRVTLGGADVYLSATEYKLLYELASNPGRVLTHDQLLQRVWGPEYSGETDLVRSFIRNLRRKLRDDAANPRFIQTERQVGYFIRNP